MGIDQIDCRIMDLIQKKPNLTHTQIASKVNRSQPTIGMRIKKLENLGILKYQAGINMKVADLCFARIELQTKNPNIVAEVVKKCPYMINMFRLSGERNVSILLVGVNYKFLDKVVNIHFRNRPEVVNVHMDIIEDVVQDFVLPLNLNFNKHLNDKCCCGKCECGSK